MQYFISRNVAIIGACGLAIGVAVVGVVVGKMSRKCETTDAVPSKQPPTVSTATTTTDNTTTSVTTQTENTNPTNESVTATLMPTERPDLRLPGDITPVHYKLYLWPDIDNFTTTGSVILKFKCLRTTRQITVHASRKHLFIDALKTLLTHEENPVNIEDQYYEEEKEFYHVIVSKALSELENYELHLTWNGIFADDLKGLYGSSYTDENEKTKWMASTQMQGPYARRVLPCLDEPHYKATFSCTLVRKKHMVALSNTDIQTTETVPGHDDWVADLYEDTPVMSTYLLAFVVCEFQHLTITTDRGIKIRAWARPELIQQAEYALFATAHIIEQFEALFNVKYTLSKSDLIAIPDFAYGAMENWGLVTYREEYMLYDPKISTVADKKLMCRVIGHELAHMWFGNLVTCEWWDHIWLNEGTARFFEFIGCDFTDPTWMLVEQHFVLDNFPSALELDALASSHPTVMDIMTNAEIEGTGDAITSSRGSCLCLMMESMVGKEAWYHGVEHHLNRLTFATSTTDDLWESLQWAVEDLKVDLEGRTMKEIMDTWTLQMGYPLLTVTRDYDNGRVTVTQTHFLRQPEAQIPPGIFNYTWEVPVFYTTSDQRNFTNPSMDWMHKETCITLKQLVPKDSWILLNAGVRGFYRILYDERNMELINEQLRLSHQNIDVRNRAQLFEDVFELARALVLDQVAALKMLEYLDREEDYLPWHAALTKLKYLDLMLVKSTSYGLFKEFLVNQIKPVYTLLGWDDQEDKFLTLLQIDALTTACYYGNEECIKMAKELYREWMKTGVNEISPDLQGIVYCTAIANGSEEEWYWAWDHYITSQTPSETTKLLQAMACSKQIWILQMYLEKALNLNGVRQQHGDRVIQYVAENVLGSYLAWNFLRQNWLELYNRYTYSSLNRMVTTVTNWFNTEWELAEVRQFVKTIIGHGDSEAYWSTTMENIAANIKWVRKNEKSIYEWLESMQHN